MKIRIQQNVLIIFLSIAFQSCNSQSTGNNEETAIERENRLINEYHKQVVISKGQEALFIPKNEISWYFNTRNFLSVENSKTNDNICFFDTLGNIQYQALVIESNEIIKIKCQDLKTGKYYNSVLQIDSIRDLDKNYPYIIKVYKNR